MRLTNLNRFLCDFGSSILTLERSFNRFNATHKIFCLEVLFILYWIVCMRKTCSPFLISKFNGCHPVV